MPRHYQRKTETKYRLEDLEKAVEAVKNKSLSLGKAATVYSVPKSTIGDYVKKEIIEQPKTGRRAIFTQEQEKELEDHIIKCSKQFYGLTIEMVRKIAFKFAEVNNLKHYFDKTSQMAGKDWYYGFKKRHPAISLRRPESTSINRITAFNESEVKLFFNNLETLQMKHKFDASRIYNVDETGISNVQRNSRILAPTGQKQVGMVTSGERGTTTTVVCALSAAGKYVPPFFIFKRKRMNPQLLRGGNADMIAAVSDSGWINENLFVDWLHHFISFAKPTVEVPVLLVLDNHESHISLACYLLCRQNGVVLLSLPPHTSHRMQPLDLTYFGPLKSAYNRECDLYMASNVGKRITQYDIVELFTKAFNRVSNIEKAANGFRAAGIWPIDTTKFDEELMDQPNVQTPQVQVAQTPNVQRIVPPEAEPHEVQLEDEPNVPEPMTPEAQKSQKSNVQEPKIAEAQMTQESNVQEPKTPEPQMTQESNVQEPKTPEAQIVKPIDELNKSIPLQEIVNVPQLSQPKTRQNSRKRHSIIITSTPMKDALAEKEQKRKRKEQNKTNEKPAKKNVSTKGKKNPKASNNSKGKKKAATIPMQYFCLVCDEKYEEPITEDWIMCYKCNLWAHEKCTTGESSSKGFLCDLCAD